MQIDSVKRWFWSVLNHWLLKIIVFGLTLIPIANISYIIGSTGANNASVDYIEFVWIVDGILRGTYDWTNYFADTFVAGSHLKAIPVLVRVLVARWFDWNVYAELYIIIGLAILKLVLIQRSFTHLARHPFQILLWPILSALVFSTSQISVFSYGDTGLWMQLIQVGLLLGIWGMTRYSGRWAGIGLMTLGGFIATWSGGSGTVVWPVFLIGLALLGFHQWFFYAIWLAAGLLAVAPYIIFKIFRPLANDFAPAATIPHPDVFIEAVGWPFSDNLQLAQSNETMGWLGLGLGATGLLLILGLRNRLVLKQSSPAFMLVLYTLLNIFLITMFRGPLAPWYTGHYILYWIGLTGLAYLLLVTHSSHRLGYGVRSAWSVFVLAVITVSYFNTNLTYSDKTFFLQTRSPASAACLRAYQTAPTYCEKPLFPVNPGRFEMVARLAKPLQRSHLSVFAPQQRWTLQGDFMLDNVKFNETTGVPEIIWTADLSSSPAQWDDFRHLNLLLHPPNTISWTVTLPESLIEAEFHSAVAISESASESVDADGVGFEVRIFSDDDAGELAFSQYLAPSHRGWHSFDLPLNRYAGQTITILLATQMGDNRDEDWALYRYPTIDIKLTPEVSVSQQPLTPANTDLSPTFSVELSADDFVFENLESWPGENLEPVQIDELPYIWRITGSNPNMLMEFSDICLSDYEYLYIETAVSADIWPRAMEIYYRLDDQALPDGIAPPIIIPLLADGEMHAYTYDLKLLDIQPHNRLTGIRLDPVSNGSSGENLVQIKEFRLIRSNRDKPTVCVR